MIKSFIFAALCAAVLVSGCALTPKYNASEVHYVESYPLVFTHQIDATNIKKETNADGTVTRKAETLTHTITVGGFTRTAVYKDAEITTEKED